MSGPDLSAGPAAPRLTSREVAVLRGIADGVPFADIASQLSLSGSSIDGAVKSLRVKFGANDRAHLVALAFRSGVLS